MRVEVEKRHIDSYKRIAKDANKAAKKKSKTVSRGKYEKDLLQRDISVENKKKKLAKNIHELIISTFSLNINKIKNKNSVLQSFRANTELIRYIIHKILSINDYLEEDLLKELGLIKSSFIVKAIKSKNPTKYLEKSGRVLSKGYIEKIEHTVYELMQRIIFFDKELLKDYKKREFRVIKNEKLGIKDLEKVLMTQTELLETLEAKIPPPNKIKSKLFTKNVFNNWIAIIFALLSNLETEYGKETEIFSIIKKNGKLRKKIDNKIKHVISEKEKLLKIQEKRVMDMKGFGKISDDYRQTFHEYVSAASL